MSVSYALSLSWYFSPKYIPPVNSRMTMKSAPRTNSSFNGLLCIKQSKVATGRMLANKPNFLRMASKPCSGRTFAVGSLSNRKSPTAANNTASARIHVWNVSSGNGSPTSSMACAPQIASSYSNSCPHFSAMALSTAKLCFITSGPIPSPGRTAIFNFINI